MKKIKTIHEATRQAVLAFPGSFTINQIKAEVDSILDFGCSRSTIRHALWSLKTEGIIKKVGSVPYNNGFPLAIFKATTNS